MSHDAGCIPIFPDPGETAPEPPPLHVTPSYRRVIVLNLRANGMPLDLDLLSK